MQFLITDSDIQAQKEFGGFCDYQHSAAKSGIYPGKNAVLGLIYCALKLNGEAGELAEHVGKAMRDDGLLDTAYLKPERRDLIVKEIGDCLWYLSALCNELNISLNEVATINLIKLRDRQLRGTQRGSGDNR